MDNKEIRNSNEYINAYAEYLKTNDDRECRALLTTGANGTVEVPDMVYDIIKTAWAKEDLMARVRTLSVKGNLKVQFEVSGSDAVVHTEGGSAVTEEELVLGIITLTPVSIKKWISLSDEVLDLRGEALLNYVYDELTYKITDKETKIATIPVGYADGLDRHLSGGRWSMLVAGHAAPTVGRICMDSCMIDVTDIEGVNEGDEVTIFSSTKGNTLEDMADVLSTISYEIMTSVSARVKRIYVRE